MPDGQTIIFVGMDETSVGYAFASRRGTVLRKTSTDPQAGAGTAQQNKNELRGSISYMSFITDRPDLQPRLPQILIGNKRRFTNGLMAAVTPNLPSNVHVWREKSHWVNVAVMKRALDLLVASLGHVPNKQIILVMDTARPHISVEVAKHAAELGLWLAVVPAGLTWLLQPLDVFGFSAFKAHLRGNYLAQRTQGPVSAIQWLNMVVSSTKFFNTRPWRTAFDGCGISGVDKLHASLLLHCPTAAAAAAAPVREPLREDLAILFPRNAAVPWWHLVRLPSRRRRRIILVLRGVEV